MTLARGGGAPEIALMEKRKRSKQVRGRAFKIERPAASEYIIAEHNLFCAEGFHRATGFKLRVGSTGYFRLVRVK